MIPCFNIIAVAVVVFDVGTAYAKDGQLNVTREPIYRKLKSSGPEHRKKKVV
jgi:hypothetical protein